MKLTEIGLSNIKSLKDLGYILPNYNRDTIIKNTKENPKWIHFGSGNIFRAFQANMVQNLLNNGVIDTGLIVAINLDFFSTISASAPFVSNI